MSCIGVVFVWLACWWSTNEKTRKSVCGGEGCAHLIDCWVRFVRERWTEYERKNKVAVCLSLSWRKIQQNGTGSSRPEEEKESEAKRSTGRKKTRGKDEGRHIMLEIIHMPWYHLLVFSPSVISTKTSAWLTLIVLIQSKNVQLCRRYLFVEAAEVSVLPHAVQDLRCCLYHFRTMSGNSAERKKHIQYKAWLFLTELTVHNTKLYCAFGSYKNITVQNNEDRQKSRHVKQLLDAATHVPRWRMRMSA